MRALPFDMDQCRPFSHEWVIPFGKRKAYFGGLPKNTDLDAMIREAYQKGRTRLPPMHQKFRVNVMDWGAAYSKSGAIGPPRNSSRAISI
jgi:hypothetical protein